MDALIEKIDQMLDNREVVIVAIDGSCASGKTTLAQELSKKYDCNVFHMDDFFLQPHQRTSERFTQPGGNVDYERFELEVLSQLKTGLEFSYFPYDCSAGNLSAPVHVLPKKLNIIEGTYSHHPYFGDQYDLRVFLCIGPELRRQRILARPEFLHKRFFEEWIPMEQTYFTHYDIKSRSHIII